MTTDALARKRWPEVLVAPVITFLAVILMLCVARIYDRLPVRPPACGFKNTFGIPCVSCGGTRSMKALSRGHFAEAIRFNPAAVTGVAASLVWFLSGLARFSLATPAPSSETAHRRIKYGTAITLLLLAMNWAYLILFLK